MDRSKIMEQAVLLGKMLSEDEEVQKLDELSQSYENNEELKTLMTEYNAQSQVLTMEYKKDDKDDNVIQLVQNRINEIYEKISNHPLIAEYNRVQESVNTLMNTVNGEITLGMTGKRPEQSNCTHDCSSCGGCH